MIGLIIASAAIALGLLAWDNPMPITDDGFWLIAQLRMKNLVVIAIVALCQAFATVAFQTVTNNRIITPSIMGFESLYVAIQTGAMYFFGVTAIVDLKGLVPFTVQLLLMVGLSLALYGWLLSGRYGNIAIMLLIGVVIGGGLGSIATFMQRTLTPSEFDILAARLFGSVSNSDSSYLPVSIPLCVLACAAIYMSSSRLNVLALGRDMTSNLGLNFKFEMIKVLFFVSILMAVSVSMIGPMIFLGFLVAMLAYQFADTYDHKSALPDGGPHRVRRPGWSVFRHEEHLLRRGGRVDHHRDRRRRRLPACHPAKGAPVITLNSVRKSYSDEVEIGPVDLQIPAGGVTALVGPNGAGKSTLLTMIGRLLGFDYGVDFGGRL